MNKHIALQLSGKKWVISGEDVESMLLTTSELIIVINQFRFVVDNPDCLKEEIKKQLWNKGLYHESE